MLTVAWNTAQVAALSSWQPSSIDQRLTCALFAGLGLPRIPLLPTCSRAVPGHALKSRSGSGRTMTPVALWAVVAEARGRAGGRALGGPLPARTGLSVRGGQLAAGPSAVAVSTSSLRLLLPLGLVPLVTRASRSTVAHAPARTASLRWVRTAPVLVSPLSALTCLLAPCTTMGRSTLTPRCSPTADPRSAVSHPRVRSPTIAVHMSIVVVIIARTADVAWAPRLDVSRTPPRPPSRPPSPVVTIRTSGTDAATIVATPP